MRKLILRILEVVSFLIIPMVISAKQDYGFTQINFNQGTPSRISHVYEGNNSLIWMSTYDGLLRYDGKRLKLYHLNSDSHLPPASIEVLQIMEDEKQKLWVLTNQGVFLYSAKYDHFVPFTWQDQQLQATSACQTNNVIIFGGKDTLYQYSYDQERITKLEKLKTENFQIRQLEWWDSHILVCSNCDKTVLFYDWEKHAEIVLPVYKPNKMSDICIDSDGNLWASEYNDGIRKISKDGHTLVHYTAQNSGLSNNLVLCMDVIDGKIWAGTDGGGINVIDPITNEIQILRHDPGNPHSLPVNTILCIHGSLKKNGVWASTSRRGLINIRSSHMRTFQNVPIGYGQGLSEKTVLSLCEEPGKDSIWIGTDGGGMNLLDTRRQTFRHFPDTWGDQVVSICNYSPDELLISTFAQGIFLFNKKTGEKNACPLHSPAMDRFIRYSGIPANLYHETDNTILAFAQPLSRYYVHEKRWEEITPMPGHDIIGMTSPIGKDGHYTYFHDTQNIYQLEKGSNRLTSLYRSDTPYFIHAACRDEQGVFWIAGSQGLYTFGQGELNSISTSLFRSASSVICDRKGHIWIGSGQDLFSYSPEENKFTLYGEVDGALKNEYLSKPVLLAQDGNIYMGGVNGLLYIHPGTEGNQPAADNHLPVIVTDLQVEETNCMAQLNDGEIVLPWGSRNIQMSFMVAGDDILHPRLFRYSLEENRPDMTTNHEAELTIPSLAAGTYPIYVSYTQNDGSWSSRQRVLTLVILPPWYRSWWFITLLITTLGISFYFLVTFLLKRKEERLKWMISEHEQKVNEEKIRFLINVSHELRTPLTLIYSPLKRMISSIRPEDPNYKQLTTAFRQSQRMKDLINMVLDVRKIEVSKEKLNLQEHPMNDWVKEVGRDFADENKGLIEYDVDPQIGKVTFDKDKCWTILSNLLINALKHTPPGKKITVCTRQTADRQHVRISVCDQGPGLKDIDPDKLFTRFYQGHHEQSGSGIGLSYAKILVGLHNGQIGACNNPDGGATFYFELPLKQVRTESVPEQQSSYLNELLSSFSEQDINVPHRTDFTHVDPKKYTVLVADDNKELVEYIADELRKHFKRVLTVYDGQTAYQTACDANPDIIVSDVMMPGMNGYELCQAIKEDISVSHIPIILLSARNDDESRKYGYLLGADSYLDKPFEMDRLVEKILNKLYNRLQTQKHYHQIGIYPVPEEHDLSKADSLFMEKLHQAINDNLNNAQLDIPFLCSQIGISRASLYNKLKAIAGMGANDYINKIRIEQAMQLIKTTSLNFTEISEKVGFATPRYFSTAFKQYTGKTPTQFKRE